MNKLFQNLSLAWMSIDKRMLQLVVLLVIVALFAFAAGAPATGGGTGQSILFQP